MFAGAVTWGGTGALAGALSAVAVERTSPNGAGAGLLASEMGVVVSSERLGAGPPATGLCLHRCESTGALVAFWGRLHDLDGLARRLGGPAHRSPAAWVLEAWRRAGTAAPALLRGDFAFAVVEPRERRVFLARDAFGTRPLYYRVEGETLLFASHLETLRRLARRAPAPDARWMAFYLAGAPRDAECSPCADVRKVAPGHAVAFDATMVPQAGRWLEWRDDAPWAERREPRWIEAYRAALVDAARVRLGDARPVAVESSGGFDSSAVVGAVAGLVADPSSQMLCLGHALAEHEGACIVGMSRLHGIGQTWIDTAWRGVVGDDRLDAAVRALGQPEEAATTTQFAEFHVESRRHGAGVLLSGYGGDEAGSHWGDAVRHELRDRRAWRALWDVSAGRGPARAARFARDVLLGTDESPRPAASDLSASLLLREEVTQALAVPAALAANRARLGARRANDAVLQLLGATHLAQRLEDCSLLAASHGMEMAWPLLDARLVQQVLSTPAIERYGPRGTPRYLHRRAMAPFVTAQIAAQRNKDMGYAALSRSLRQGRPLAQVVDAARALETDLHPALDELVDRRRLRTDLARAEAGTLSGIPFVYFRRHVLRLRWLDRWLRLQATPA